MIAAHTPPPGYPVHWIFDYFPQFSEQEQQIALLLFDGRKVAEIASVLHLTEKTILAAIDSIRCRTNLGVHMLPRWIESGTFFRKWGFTTYTPSNIFSNLFLAKCSNKS